MKTAERRVHDFLNQADKNPDDDVWGIETHALDGMRVFEWWSAQHECFCALIVVDVFPESHDVRKLRTRYRRFRAARNRKLVEEMVRDGDSREDAISVIYCTPLFLGILCTTSEPVRPQEAAAIMIENGLQLYNGDSVD